MFKMKYELFDDENKEKLLALCHRYLKELNYDLHLKIRETYSLKIKKHFRLLQYI